MIYALIAAGGVGSRMGSHIPKQFLELNGVPILVRTVRAFTGYVDKVYVGVPENVIADTVELFSESGLSDFVSVCCGGMNRMDTLNNLINKIEAEQFVSDEDVVLTHDAVRPFINYRIIKENIEKAKAFGACGTYVPTVDTVAISEDGGFLTSVPERKMVFNAQTPQSATYAVLKKAFEENKHRFEDFTDLCGMLNFSKVPVAIVMGEYTNIKITNPSDMIVARGIAGE